MDQCLSLRLHSYFMAYKGVGTGHRFNHEGGSHETHESKEDQQQSSKEEARQAERFGESQRTSTKDQVEHVDQCKL